MAKVAQKKASKKQSKKLPKSLKKQWALAAILSLVGIGVIAAAVFWPNSSSKDIAANPVSINDMIDVCEVKKTITFTCYKNELTKITQQHGPEKAMALVKEQYNNVPYIKSQCHQLTHIIGRAALSKYNNELADTYAHGDQFCWSGYYHGAMEQLSTAKGYNYIIKNANEVCKPIAAKGKFSFYHYNCVHGMGHGYMFATNGELFESLNDCDSITDSWERTSCYGGVFMQNIMNEQSPDSETQAGTKYLKSDQPMYPCTAVDVKYKDQ
jgi:hypothetical protein